MDDFRNLIHGYEIPTERYSDQPYIVIADDGTWVCTMTTGRGVEGEHGQHIIIVRSRDQGKTWSDVIPLESSDDPESSYAVLMKTPFGRIYCFYNYNLDNTRALIADEPEAFSYSGGVVTRVDSQGHFMFRYSDDNGATWSSERYEIPVRETDIDRRNVYGGKIKFFWNVGRAFTHDGCGYVPLHKVGGFGHGFFTSSEGVLFKSDNICRERNASALHWEMLPDGEIGLRAPDGGGPISEEHSFSVLSDGSFFCVYRTIDGHPTVAYSRDGGHTWPKREYMRYADGRLVYHPRAANFAWRASNGKFLYWYHNNCNSWYDERNPVWVLAGEEADAPEGRVIHWSQPEILLYDDDSYIRMSYPDFVEDSGRYFVTETQKDIARTHEIPAAFLEKLWSQQSLKTHCTQEPMAWIQGSGEMKMPLLPPFRIRDNDDPAYHGKDMRAGFTLEFWLKANAPAGVLLDSRSQRGEGILVEKTPDSRIRIWLSDGRTENTWACDEGALAAGQDNHVGIIVDGGPKIISYVINGKFNDGDGKRPFGFGRFSADMHDVQGADMAKVGGGVKVLKVYNEALMVTDLIGNYRADMEA